MGNRTARWPAAALAILAFALLFSAAPTPAMAQRCIASPSDTAPQGLHWYYRVDRSSGRHCWYLAARGSRVTRHHRAGSHHSVHRNATREARAEVSSAASERKPAPAPRSNPILASTGGDTSSAPIQVTDPAPSPESVPAGSTEPMQPAADNGAMLPTTSDPSAAEAKPEKSISLKMLLLVLGGALVLAGLIGSFAARLGSASSSDKRIRLQTAGDQRWPTSGAPGATLPLHRHDALVEDVPLVTKPRSSAAPPPRSRPVTASSEDRFATPAAYSDTPRGAAAPARSSARAAASAATFRAPAPTPPTSRARARTETSEDFAPETMPATRAPNRSRPETRAEASRTATRQDSASEIPSETRPETRAKPRSARPARASDKPAPPTLDLDAITTVLERLAEPQSRPASATDSEDLPQTRRGRFGARA